MQKRVLFISVLLILSLIITGCGGRSAQDDPTTTFIPTGTEGIAISFVQDQPPAQMYTGVPFDVLAEVKNRGTYDVQNVDIYLSGYDPYIIRVSPDRQSATNLEGKSTFNPEGDITTVEFSAPDLVLPVGTASYRPNLMLSACYQYATVASPIACIDSNPQYLAEDKACTVTNINTGGSQGAPVAVTSIEAQATPSDMIFRIHISNVGGGQVFDTAAYQNCPFNLQYGDLNKIYVEQVTLGSGQAPGSVPYECKPSNPIRLVNGQATVFCKFAQQPGNPAYQTPLTVKLVYGYKNSIQKQIEIQNLDQ